MKRALPASLVLHVLVGLGLAAFGGPTVVSEEALVVELLTVAPPAVEEQPVAAQSPSPPLPTPPVRNRPAAPAASPSSEAPVAAEPSPPASAPSSAQSVADVPADAEPAYVPPSSHADYLANPPPPYPIVATRRGWQGTVVLAVDVDEEGRPVRVRVETSSGHPVLDEAAATTVTRWRFVPARRGSRAIAAAVRVPIRFNLANG